MEIHIDTSLFLILLLLLLLFLPHFHLFFIFFIMSVNEWLHKLCKKISNLTLATYDLIICIISNPIILTGLLIYLCVSITRFTAI